MNRLEKEFLAEVTAECDARWLPWAHIPDSRPAGAGTPGFPDLVIVGRAPLFVELKSPYGRMSLAQIQWRRVLQAAGARWELWRPEDLDSGRVGRELGHLIP